MAGISLADKLRQARLAKLNQTTAATTNVAETAVTTADKPVNLSSISLQLSEQNSKLAAHIEEQEQKGVYQFAAAINDVEGLDADDFILRLKSLDAATVEKTPDIRTFSMQIRKNLQQYPELTHILSDDQLGILVRGVLELAGVETAPKTKQGKAKADKIKLDEFSNMSMDELF